MLCPTVRTLLMNLMCSCWHGMLIFLLWLIKKLKWFMAAVGVWVVLSCGASYYAFSSPHLCHRGIKLYLPSCWECCAAGEILHFSCNSKTHKLQRSGRLTDRLRVIMALEVWDERFMQSAHSLLQFYVTIRHFSSGENILFVRKKNSISVHYGELHEDRKEIKFKRPDLDTLFF